MSYPILLLPIVLTSSNNRIRMKEGAGAIGNVDLTVGTYFVRGDGAAGDLLAELATKLSAFGGGGNAYTVTVAWSSDPAAPTAVITITRSAGSDTFQIDWANASATFDEALLGFADAASSNDATPKVSTLSPTSAWVSDSPYEDLDYGDEHDTYAVRANSGVVRDGVVGGPYDVLRLSFGLVDGRRTHHNLATADPDAAFSSFMRRWITGRPVELHLSTAGTYPALGALSSSTEIGDRWHVAEGSREQFAARRLDRATSLWSWELNLWGHV